MKHNCPQCGNYHLRGVSLDGLLVKDGKILLIKRGNDPYKGYWALPGGYLEYDERTEEACCREFEEETGVKVEIEKLVGVFSAPKRHPLQVVTAAYSLHYISGEAHAADDALDAKWFDLDALPELAFDHKEMIDTYLKSRTTSIQ